MIRIGEWVNISSGIRLTRVVPDEGPQTVVVVVVVVLASYQSCVVSVTVPKLKSKILVPAANQQMFSRRRGC